MQSEAGLGAWRSTANDSLSLWGTVMSSAPRVTAVRVAKLDEQLGSRDRAVIDSLDLLRVCSVRQLERLHFVDGTDLANARACRKALERLATLGVITRLERRVGGVRAGSAGFVYALDTAGQRLASGSGPAGGRRLRRPWTPGLAFLRHRLDVSEVYVRLRETERTDDLELLEFWAEPLCWRRFTGIGGARTVLKPDAFARVGVGEFEHLSFIEVDRATESAPTIARKLAVYRRYFQTGREQERFGAFPRVVFLVPDEERKAVLVDVFAAQPAETWELFRVAVFDDAVAALTEGDG